MKAIYLVLGVSNWNFTDERTGEVRQGISVHYSDVNNVQKDNNVNGSLPVKITGHSSFYSRFSTLPGFYELDFGVRSLSGKPSLFLESVGDFKGSIAVKNA